MKHYESIRDFSNRFLHICYEFSKEDADWDLFKKMFQHLVHVSLHGEPKFLDVSTFPTPANHETPLILDEEFTSPFVLCHPPFPISMRLSPFDDNKVGKSTNEIPNPTSHSSSILLPLLMTKIQ